MKPLLCITFLLVFFGLNAQEKNRKHISDALNKNYWTAIPSQNSEPSFHIAKFEVTNSLYRQFLNSLDDNEIQTHTPKNEGWEQFINTDNGMAKYYFAHRAFDDYPVNNIDMNNVVAFTNWLTNYYNQNPKRQFEKVIIRLPSEQEWEFAAKGGGEIGLLPWGSPYMTNRNGPLCNYLRVNETLIANRQSNDGTNEFELIKPSEDWKWTLTKPVGSYLVNGYGTYDMAGNISELTSTKDVASGKWVTKGGSFAHTAHWCQIDKKLLFDQSNAFTGIRLVLEVIEE